MADPMFYVAIGDTPGSSSNVPLIIGIAQFFISVIATLLFNIMLSGRIFGDRVAGKDRNYLESQTFTASQPTFSCSSWFGSILLWCLVFGHKLTEPYFFPTLNFRDQICVMVCTKIQGCEDKFFGSALCRNQAAFTLTIIFIVDLFFLDTFLWYILGSTPVISIHQ